MIRTAFIDLFCLFFILLLFYLLWLGSFPLFIPDEGRYAEVAREMLQSGNYLIPHLNGNVLLDKPVFHYWLAAFAMKLFGPTEWGARLFTALFGVIGCLVTYCAGRLCFNRLTALFAAIILSTSPLYFLGSHYANLDLEVAVLMSSTLLCCLIGFSRATPFRYFLYGAYFLAALALLSKGLIGIVLPACVLICWIISLNRFALLKKAYFFSGFCLFLIVALPWYFLVQEHYPSFFQFFFIHEQVMRFLSTSTFNNLAPWWFYVPIVYLGCFPWSIFLIYSLFRSVSCIHRKDHHDDQLLFLLLWLSIIFIFFSIPHSKTLGYILPIFPGIALIIGYHLACLWKNPTKFFISTSYVQFIIVNSVLIATIWLSYHNDWVRWPATFFPCLKAITLIAASSVLAACFSLYYISTSMRLKFLMILSAIYSILCLLIFVHHLTFFNQNSVKPLAIHLKKHITPQDMIIGYFHYYYDLPFYLQQPISIVYDWDDKDLGHIDNWATDLWRSMMLEKQHRKLLITESTFKKQWHNKKRLFVLVDERYLNTFLKSIQPHYLVKFYQHTFLFCNRLSTDSVDASRRAKFKSKVTLKYSRVLELAITQNLLFVV